MLQRLSPDNEWAAGLVASLPSLWAQDALTSWRQAWGKDRTAGNLAHLTLTTSLEALRIPLDASDADICEAAEKLAARAFDLSTIYHQPADLIAAMGRMCKGQGVEPPDPDKTTEAGQIARMVEHMWWRRRLRRVHGRAVEKAAIALGRVNKRREIYASSQTCKRVAQQDARNAATLESTTLVNELGEEFTLAELAAKGPSNKAIKRAELMTRIAGFERIARDLGHAGLFLTITCPSRMHKFRLVGPRWMKKEHRKVMANQRYDGTTPREANQYLGDVWARIRAKLGRKGIKLYGFRIAEPQHDGTPHWHMLVFHQAEDWQAIRDTVLEHALRDSGDEPGARRHRCDFKPIDWSKGTAAGYIAKYIAKNIDGYRVEKDLYGNPTFESSQRVEAWARTWGIRQFQQVGGPPVGPWRELRRVKELPEGAPAHMVNAWEAVNKLTQLDGHPEKSVAWDRYVKAQGGVFCGRAYRVRVAMKERPGMVNAYGEPAGPVPCGVETQTTEIYTPAHMAWMGSKAERVVHWFAESDRHTWQIKRTGTPGLGRVATGQGEALTPWTCVNNCTGTPETQKGQRNDRTENRDQTMDGSGQFGTFGRRDRSHTQQPRSDRQGAATGGRGNEAVRGLRGQGWQSHVH